MHKKSFFNRESTAITALFRGSTIAELISKSRTAEEDGADGIAIELSHLPPELRSVDNLRMVINSVNLPFMFICYRNDCWLGEDDDARQECLLTAAEAGAEVIDVIGDLYNKSPKEITFDEAAIERQRLLISKIHDRGAKALISSHVINDRAQTTDEVLEIALAQKARGADISKVVTIANTDEEFLEAVKTTITLNTVLQMPHIYLCGGKYGRLQRFMGTKLGVDITFGVVGYDPDEGFSQPTIRSFRNALDSMKV